MAIAFLCPERCSLIIEPLNANQSKVSFLKKVPVCLLRETSIPAQLKEIDTIRYGHER